MHRHAYLSDTGVFVPLIVLGAIGGLQPVRRAEQLSRQDVLSSAHGCCNCVSIMRVHCGQQAPYWQLSKQQTRRLDWLQLQCVRCP